MGKDTPDQLVARGPPSLQIVRYVIRNHFKISEGQIAIVKEIRQHHAELAIDILKERILHRCESKECLILSAALKVDVTSTLNLNQCKSTDSPQMSTNFQSNLKRIIGLILTDNQRISTDSSLECAGEIFKSAYNLVKALEELISREAHQVVFTYVTIIYFRIPQGRFCCFHANVDIEMADTE